MKIVIIRHGETYANVLNHEQTTLYTGSLNNDLTNLTLKGRQMAEALRTNQDVLSIQKMYSSKLNRAIETALLAKPNISLHMDKRLNERSLGIFEGKQKIEILSSKDYQKYIFDDQFNKFRTDFIQKAPEGENYEETYQRCRDFLNSLDFNEDITIGIVSHLNTIRCLFLNLLDIYPREKIFDLKIDHTTPYVFEGKNLNQFKLISHKLDSLF